MKKKQAKREIKPFSDALQTDALQINIQECKGMVCGHVVGIITSQAHAVNSDVQSPQLLFGKCFNLYILNKNYLYIFSHNSEVSCI